MPLRVFERCVMSRRYPTKSDLRSQARLKEPAGGDEILTAAEIPPRAQPKDCVEFCGERCTCELAPGAMTRSVEERHRVFSTNDVPEAGLSAGESELPRVPITA